MTKLIRSALTVLAVNALSGPLAMAAPDDGSSAANAGLSAAQILRDYSASASGVYWIDADGAGGATPVQMYADMATTGGGWMLVRHATHTGGWINVSDSLGGSATLNPGESTNPLSALGVTEDPWVGFEGDHFTNISKMMYGEAGYGGPHINYKNAHLGVNVFVRELNAPPLPVPEPDTVGMMLAGGAVLAAMLRRRRTPG